ncbi:MAG: acetylornithine/succinylornithine family transaminase [Clostridiales bacterium]|nr:acetylornithine/succinylornithine family transaminase [Clostridiales bacterium]
MDFQTIRQRAEHALMPTYGRFPVALEKGSGATATDSEGRILIDFGSGIGVNSLGFCDAEWADAVARQAARLQHISNLYYQETQSLFAAELCEAAGMSRAFLCNSGAEANECAIKLARLYAAQNGREGGAIVTLQNSFHGRTLATLEATGQDAFHADFGPFTGGFTYVPAEDSEALASALREGACAVLLECVQGEGGVLPLSNDYLRLARRLCDEHGALLMIDEVQTGAGRTGRFLACEHAGIRPDVVTLAKGLGGGLPVGACLCAEPLAAVLSAGKHGSTFGGNPVVCAGGRVVLSRLMSPGFLDTVTRKGELLRTRLKAMKGVRSVRGLGMMLGIELTNGDARRTAERCLENGLLVLTAKTLLRLLPPLTITDEELNRGLDILEMVLAETTADTMKG